MSYIIPELVFCGFMPKNNSKINAKISYRVHEFRLEAKPFEDTE